MKYFHHLKLLMTFLSARIPGFETKVLKDVSNVIKDSVEGSCRAFETDSVLSRIFSEVPGKQVVFLIKHKRVGFPKIYLFAQKFSITAKIIAPSLSCQ